MPVTVDEHGTEGLRRQAVSGTKTASVVYDEGGIALSQVATEEVAQIVYTGGGEVGIRRLHGMAKGIKQRRGA